MQIQALIVEPSIEALDEAVLDWPTWANEPQLDIVLAGPLVKGFAGEFGPVIDNDPPRQWARQRDLAQHSADPVT